MNWNDYKTYRLCFALAFIILLVSVATSCKLTQNSADSKDLSYIYNPTKNPFTPRFSVLNQSDESSVVSVKLFTSDLFFSEANPQGVPTALIQLNITLFNVSQDKVLADTALYNLSVVKEEGRLEYIFRIPLQVEPGNRYVAEIRILDKLRMSISQNFVNFNTISNINRYNFVASGLFKGNELFNPVVRVNEYLNLKYIHPPLDSLYVSYYRSYEEVPDPPSMMLPEKTLDYDPETTIALPYSDTLPIMFPNKGIYFFKVSRDADEGYTFMNFGPSFPSMTTPETMTEPLAYLATKDELNVILSSLKPKAALDDFWISCGGNIEKARELIRIYYTRVMYSNYYFTSFKEGWRSDRGMIYIIYGPPDKIYKSVDQERWGYLKPSIKSTWGGRVHIEEDYMFFNFKKKDNKFSDNDYYLSRSETPVTFWDQAVLSWRKGIVFRLDNPTDI